MSSLLTTKQNHSSTEKRRGVIAILSEGQRFSSLNFTNKVNFAIAHSEGIVNPGSICLIYRVAIWVMTYVKQYLSKM